MYRIRQGNLGQIESKRCSHFVAKRLFRECLTLWVSRPVGLNPMVRWATFDNHPHGRALVSIIPLCRDPYTVSRPVGP
jgi:hypothetical protein